MSNSNSVSLNIVNKRNTTVYIYFSNTSNSITGQTSTGTPLKISAFSGPNTAEPYPVAANGGTLDVTISQLDSGRVGFSLDQLTYGDMKQFNNSNQQTNGGDYTKRFDKFELNVTNGSATCDMTALDWVGFTIFASKAMTLAVLLRSWLDDPI